MKESELRDAISKRVEVLGKGLVLLNKEQFIPNSLGTRSFIDLYAKDEHGNHVLIELKRSRPATREAIHEVIKYVEGVKSHFGAREDEIKIIVASTEWEELIVPFSRFVKESTLSVKGLKLEIVEENIISSAIDVLKSYDGRLIAPWYEIFWYENIDSLHKGEKDIVRFLEDINIDDYIYIKIKVDDTLIEPPCNERQSLLSVVFNRGSHRFLKCEYLIVLAMQIQSEEVYLSSLINQTGDPEYIEDIVSNLEDYESVFGRLCFLQEALMDCAEIYCDDYEIGYPAKFVDYVDSDGFEVIDIFRNGIFSRNNLLSDDEIMSELRGNNGAGGQSLDKECFFSDKSSVAELKRNIENALKDNDVFRSQIYRAISEIEKDHPLSFVKSRINNPSTGLFTIFYYIKNSDDESFLPGYSLYVYDNSKLVRVYVGALVGDICEVDLSSVVKRFYDGDKRLLMLTSSCGGREKRDLDVLEYIGLRYTAFKVEIEGEIKKHYIYRDERWRDTDSINPMSYFRTYLENNLSFTKDVFDMVSSWDNGSYFICDGDSEDKPISFKNIIISKEEVESETIEKMKERIGMLMSDRSLLMSHQGEINIFFDGYNDDAREIVEIPEIKNYIDRIVKEIPYWFYFLDLKSVNGSLAVMLNCYSGCFVEKDSKSFYLNIDADKVSEFIGYQWDGLNYITDEFFLGEKENERISMEVNEYFRSLFVNPS